MDPVLGEVNLQWPDASLGGGNLWRSEHDPSASPGCKARLIARRSASGGTVRFTACTHGQEQIEYAGGAHAIAVKLSSRAAQATDGRQAAVAQASGELADLAERAAAAARPLLANARPALRRADAKAADLAEARLTDFFSSK
jgi:transposase, IS5 family